MAVLLPAVAVGRQRQRVAAEALAKHWSSFSVSDGPSQIT